MPHPRPFNGTLPLPPFNHTEGGGKKGGKKDEAKGKGKGKKN